MRFRKGLFAGVAAAALVVGGYVVAQVTLPQVASMSGTVDLVQVIPGGQPRAGNQYALAGLAGSMASVSYQVPITAFSIVVPNNITALVLNPAGTLGTGTITMPVVPSDGEEFCWISTQTQTAVTIAANTGQSLAGATLSAGVANTWYCWRYIGATSTWYRIQ